MAGVAVCYETPTRFARYTVSSATTIPKGTLLKLTSPNTAAAASADNDVFGGIAWMEKNSSDASTEISAALDGVWGISHGSVAISTCGVQMVIHQANEVKSYTTLDDEKGYVVGQILESVASAAPVVVKVRLNK